MSGFCTYDNPVTMRREHWRDGMLISGYSAELLYVKKGGVDGPAWESGRVVGDKAAMIPKDQISDASLQPC